MKTTSGAFARVGCAILIGLIIGRDRSAFAGWTGLIDGSGKGWASVNVRSSTLQTNRVTTVNNLLYPSAAMAPTTGYKTNATLPAGASTNTYSRIKGLLGGIWQAAAKASIGDGTDNLELQKRVKIAPSDCASITFDSMINQSQAEFAANGNSGTITVNAKATGGTALWLRGFEFTGSMSDVPSDNPDTVENESIEYMKVHGLEKFETLVLGPFEFGGSNNCPLIVPFTLKSSNLEHLVLATDGVALSLPLVVECPSNIVVKCDQPFSYSPAQYAGCGDIKITYSPAPPPNGVFPAGSFAVGVTPVTVTATDSDGHSTSCTFTVTVTDTTPPVVPALATLTGEASVTVPQPPPATDNCRGTVTATTTDPLVYTNQGVFTVHWLYDDGNGNASPANQTVIVDDVTPPVAPTIPDAIGECGAPVTVTAPTAIDAVVGRVIGTTSSPLTYMTLGTNVIVWTFDDGNGNTSTATQKVVVTGLTFHGFDAPINGTGGTCSSPLRTATVGNNLPVKFDTTCAGLPYYLGRPTLSIQRSANPTQQPCATLTSVGGGDFTLVADEWHFNWDTSGQLKGNYKLTATLQDGSQQFVWIRLK